MNIWGEHTGRRKCMFTNPKSDVSLDYLKYRKQVSAAGLHWGKRRVAHESLVGHGKKLACYCKSSKRPLEKWVQEGPCPDLTSLMQPHRLLLRGWMRGSRRWSCEKSHEATEKAQCGMMGTLTKTTQWRW